ncbi:MAG: EamA family transporter [Bacteroidetes bacterium]|nr:EamA family transporter [Bacteroidota bacterium]
MACILWSSAFAGIKIGLKYTTPLQFAGLRFMLAGLMLLPLCHNFRIEFNKALKNKRRILIISLFQTAIMYTLFYQGISRVPAAVTAVIIGGGPLFVALMAHFITGQSERMTPKKAIALITGFLGIVILSFVKESDINNPHSVTMGILMLICASLSGSYGNILVSQKRIGMSPLLLNAIQIFTGGLIIFIVSLFAEGAQFTPKPYPYYISLVYLSFLSAGAFTLWFTILSRPEVKVSEINVWKFIIPVLGAILSWLLIPEEYPAWYTFVGMLLIGMAVLIMYGKFQIPLSHVKTFKNFIPKK